MVKDGRIISLRLDAVSDKDLLDYLETLPRFNRSEFIRSAMRQAMPTTPRRGATKTAPARPSLPKTPLITGDDNLVYVDDDQM